MYFYHIRLRSIPIIIVGSYFADITTKIYVISEKRKKKIYPRPRINIWVLAPLKWTVWTHNTHICSKMFYSIQQIRGEHVVSAHWAGTCLLMLLTLICKALTSQFQQVHVTLIPNGLLNVSPRDVIPTSSTVECVAICRQTSWCASANMAPDRSTCHLLSEEVSDVTSLESAEGWSYLRE